MTTAHATRAMRAKFAARLGQAFNLPERTLEAQYGSTAMDGSRAFRNANIVEVMRDHLEARDGSAPNDDHKILAAALAKQAPGARPGTLEAAGYSTFTDALGSVSTLILTQVYDETSGLAQQIAAQLDVADFKAYISFRLEQSGEFAKVGPGGEVQKAQLETKNPQSVRAETYGSGFYVPRSLFINNELAFITNALADLGRRAGIALERALIELVCESADSFYSTANGNRINTSGAGFGVTTYVLGYAAMANQKDSKGRSYGARPKFLLVPSSLIVQAPALFAGMRDEERPIVVTSPDLENSSIPGASSSTFYLVANPLVLPAFGIAYLNGQREPVIRMQADGSGMKAVCYFDFGAARIDSRAAVKVALA